jgi:hypothetical protein
MILHADRQRFHTANFMSTGLRYKILVAENFFRNSDVELAS